MGLSLAITDFAEFPFGFLAPISVISTMQSTQQSNRFLWEMFLETCLGIVIALIFAVLFWPETASQQLEQEIYQTLIKLSSFYEIAPNYYLQGRDSSTSVSVFELEI